MVSEGFERLEVNDGEEGNKKRQLSTAERIKGVVTEKRFRQTLCYCLCFCVLGLALAAPGPALLALGERTSSSVSDVGLVFVARSFGYLIGSAVGGPLFDKFNGNYLLSGSLFLMIVGNFCVPLATNVYVLATTFVGSGFSMGFLDTGGNVSILWLYGEEAGPYMQSLHFFFGAGALLAPLIVGWAMDFDNGNPKWGFWTIAFVTLPLCFWLLSFSVVKKNKEEETKKGIGKKEWAVVLLTGLFLCVYVGAEVSAGGYLYSYAVIKKIEDESSGAYLTSSFWAALTAGRLIAVPVSVYLSAEKSLIINLVGCIATTLLWLFYLDSRAVLWIVTVLYGLFMSSTFPTAINLAEMYVSLTGKLASIFVVGASFGEMLIPLLVASTFESKGPYFLVIILLVCSILGTLVYGVEVFIGRTTSKYNQVQQNDTNIQGDEKEIIETLIHHSPEENGEEEELETTQEQEE